LHTPVCKSNKLEQQNIYVGKLLVSSGNSKTHVNKEGTQKEKCGITADFSLTHVSSGPASMDYPVSTWDMVIVMLCIVINCQPPQHEKNTFIYSFQEVCDHTSNEQRMFFNVAGKDEPDTASFSIP
jgi:hypothetical protein